MKEFGKNNWKSGFCYSSDILCDLEVVGKFVGNVALLILIPVRHPSTPCSRTLCLSPGENLRPLTFFPYKRKHRACIRFVYIAFELFFAWAVFEFLENMR